MAVAAPGLRFTERMSGFFSTRATGRFGPAWVQGRDDGSLLEFVLTIEFDDLDSVLVTPSAPGRLRGTVLVPELSPHRMTVTEGTFVLLEQDLDRVETWHMRYRMGLLAEDGRSFRFDGFKTLQDRPGMDAWADTTTLFVTITRDGGQEVVGRGVMRLSVGDFLRQLLTFRVLNVPSPARRLAFLRAFMGIFLRSLLRVYGGPLDEASRFPSPDKLLPERKPLRPLALPEPEYRWYDGDGWHAGPEVGPAAWLRLTRYHEPGRTKGPVILGGGFGMSARSFAIDTIECNMAEFLFGKGYDVWLLDYRASIDLPSSSGQFTLDDISNEDWPIAVAEVRRLVGGENGGASATVQAYGHCVGSVTLLMALLDGMPGVRSAICAQFPAHPLTSWVNRLKARLRLTEYLARAGLLLLRPDIRASIPDFAVDLALRAVPLASRERCGQAVCRWINAIYGCTHRHRQLNQATHEAVNWLFGVGNIESLDHLARMMRKGLAVDHQGRNLYLEHPENLLGVDLLLLQGEDNYIFLPEGTARTVRWVRNRNGPGDYQRRVLPGYAHLDAVIGRDAARDVFPQIVEHLDRTNP